MSDRVQDDVQGKIDIAFEDAGEQQLKNIARPVRVYRVGVCTDEAAGSRQTMIRPDKPSIAVLPFQNMSGDLEQEYFVDDLKQM